MGAIPATNDEEAKPAGKTIVVLGSPSPDQKSPYWFITAAQCNGFGEDTLWLAEYTGYYMYEVLSNLKQEHQSPLDYLNRNYATKKTNFGWITPRHSLVEWLNKLSIPDGSIASLIIYSHGVPGLIALRHGWADYNKAEDYGLTKAEADGLTGVKFSDDAVIEINACSTGISTGSGKTKGSLAQKIANQLHHPVLAWTGRTSYAGVNAGTCRVRASEYTGSLDRLTEAWRRLQSDGNPFHSAQQVIFQPETGAGE